MGSYDCYKLWRYVTILLRCFARLLEYVGKKHSTLHSLKNRKIFTNFINRWTFHIISMFLFRFLAFIFLWRICNLYFYLVYDCKMCSVHGWRINWSEMCNVLSNSPINLTHLHRRQRNEINSESNSIRLYDIIYHIYICGFCCCYLYYYFIPTPSSNWKH